MKQYKQLTQEQRYLIYVLKQEKYSNRQMAKMIKVHHSTVSRELKRNIVHGFKVYRHGTAQRLALERRKVCRKPIKLNRANRKLIKDMLQRHWSPEQVSGRLKLLGLLDVSHQAIYNYIRKNKAEGGKLHRYLRRKKKYRKRHALKPGIVDRVFIDERPKEVDLRNRIGDWEVDTIVSRKHKDVLVTLVERFSRLTIVGKSPSKHAYHVARVIRNLFKMHKDKVLTITSDNGTEFAQHKKVSKWMNADYYFCHPYSSWERGLNENTNGLIRQYVPKGSDFSQLNRNNLIQIMLNLNNRPRKSLNYQTPMEVYYGT